MQEINNSDSYRETPKDITYTQNIKIDDQAFLRECLHKGVIKYKKQLAYGKGLNEHCEIHFEDAESKISLVAAEGCPVFFLTINGVTHRVKSNWSTRLELKHQIKEKRVYQYARNYQ